MTAWLLFTLFAASAALAIGTMAASWRRHGAAAMALRGELAGCGASRELRYRVTELKAGAATAKIFRPDFTAAKLRHSVMHCPDQRHRALHAAA